MKCYRAETIMALPRKFDLTVIKGYSTVSHNSPRIAGAIFLNLQITKRLLRKTYIEAGTKANKKYALEETRTTEQLAKEVGEK